jgi:hypothetical protein
MSRIASTATGWKDPQLALTLEAWLPHLPARPRIVVCLRSPEDYLRSVTRVWGLVDRETTLDRWAKRQRRLLDVIRDYQLEATCIEYERLVREPEATVRALAAFAGRDLDAKYIEPAHRNFAFSVPSKYAALYREVMALAEQPGQISEPLALQPHQQPPSIDDYVAAVRQVEDAVMAAYDEWTARVGTPEPELARPMLVDTVVIDKTRAASERYEQALTRAQAVLGGLTPPPMLEPFHDLTLTWVDQERLVARLLREAASGPSPDQAVLAEALEAWRRFSSPDAVREIQAERQQAFERCLQTVG